MLGVAAMTNAFERALDPSPPLRPTLLRGAIFHFGFVYWGLYCVLIIFMNSIDNRLMSSVSRAFGAFAVWVGKTILGIGYEFRGVDNGSGDKTSDWVLILCVACLALVSAVVWPLLDRRHARDAQLREGLRIAVRYTLAFSVLGYGLSKLFVGQFPAPHPGRLVQRFGDASPMGLLWTFMGASPAYVVFSGALETLGAGLLLFRRTTMLGALVLAGVMTNVVLLNFCYDVPVKLCSSHYLAMCILLLLPDLRRLANVIVLDRVAQPVARDLVLPRRWMRVTRRVVKYGAIATVVTLHLVSIVHWYRMSNADEPRAWYDGYWMVTSFHRDGREVPASTTEINRWSRVRFQTEGDKLWLRWRLTSEAAVGDLYNVAIDEAARTLTLTFDKEQNDARQPGPGLGVVVLRYVRIDDGHLQFDGRVGTADLSVLLEHVDTSSMLLKTRGFHWINEAPYNR